MPFTSWGKYECSKFFLQHCDGVLNWANFKLQKSEKLTLNESFNLYTPSSSISGSIYHNNNKHLPGAYKGIYFLTIRTNKSVSTGKQKKIFQ